MRTKQCLAGVLALALGLAIEVHAAALRVPALFGDNACVQTGRPIAIWGWGDPGSKVSIEMGGSSAQAVADADGRWKTQLPALKAGGPYTLTVQSGEQKVESRNLLAGEVWLASGQSNMFFPLARTQDAVSDVPAARNEQLRLFRNEVVPSFEPAAEPRGKWEICTPESAAEFSGVAYFFGQHLQKELNVPVGLIQTSLGGTPIEGWLPPDLWKESADFEALRKEQERLADEHARKTYERLLGAWKKRGSPAGKEPSKPDDSAVDQNDPSACFQSGIVPLVPYTLAGFLWYQGEWNTGRPEAYDKLLAQLVSCWRALWGEGDLPFYVVQLPSIGTKLSANPVERSSGWAALREKQATVLKLPHTGLAVTIDVGGELHPPRKREVGERLARLALANAYQRDVQARGPELASAQAEAGRLVLAFDHAEGLVLKPVNERTGFAIAGDDKVFYPAEAKVDGQKIVLGNAAVAAPQHVRYLWGQNPQATVFNGAGLPAAPFRTDAWDDFTVIPYEKSSTAK